MSCFLLLHRLDQCLVEGIFVVMTQDQAWVSLVHVCVGSTRNEELLCATEPPSATPPPLRNSCWAANCIGPRFSLPPPPLDTCLLEALWRLLVVSWLGETGLHYDHWSSIYSCRQKPCWCLWICANYCAMIASDERSFSVASD